MSRYVSITNKIRFMFPDVQILTLIRHKEDVSISCEKIIESISTNKINFIAFVLLYDICFALLKVCLLFIGNEYACLYFSTTDYLEVYIYWPYIFTCFIIHALFLSKNMTCLKFYLLKRNRQRHISIKRARARLSQ